MTARAALWDVAVEQYGYVTAAQVRGMGISKDALGMLVARGKLERRATAVYRFPEMPVTEYDAYMQAVLWTGNPDARLSHDTALACWDVCDINPDRTHIAVPKAARIRRAGGEVYVIHREHVPASDAAWWRRVPSVRLSRAVGQCIDTGIPTYLIHQAVDNGRRRGLLSTDEYEILVERLEQRHGWQPADAVRKAGKLGRTG
jgi:predicted transcriptional regulator of viral defense system